MPREAIALHVNDISAFARNLRRALAIEPGLPGHLSLLNHLARAGGFRNFQHLKQHPAKGHTQSALVDDRRLAAALRCFDAEARMCRWPSRTVVQALCLTAIWARLPARRDLTEADVNATIDRWHTFGDRALVRRSLIDHGLATRKRDGSTYKRTETAPGPEALALIQMMSKRHGDTG